MMSENITSVSNLGFSAFLLLNGFKLVGTPEKTDKGKFNFYFEIDKEVYDSNFTEFCSGDFCKFDNNLVNLKRMLPRY